MFKTVIYFLLLICFAILIYIIIILCKSRPANNFHQNFDNISERFTKSHTNRINCPIYYINLARSSTRKDFMEKQFKKFHITNFKRIIGIDGAQIKKPIKEFEHDHTDSAEGIKFWNNYTNFKHNELACTLSHLHAIRTAYNDGLQRVIILEDDASIALMPYWDKSIDDFIDNDFPKDWTCVSLFNMACYIDKKAPAYIPIKNTICNGSVAYIINRAGMADILNTMDADMLVMDKHHKQNNNTKSKLTSLADVFIFNRIKHCYERKIPLFIPYNDDDTMNSTIHTHHTYKHNLFANEIIKLYVPNHTLRDLK